VVSQGGSEDHDETLVWRQPDGTPVSCREKIKVLNENLAEIEELCQDALEDAVLMGCDERQVRDVMRSMVNRLVNPYADRRNSSKTQR
jgi:hypothetical protein